MIRKKINDIILELSNGDIIDQPDIDVIVNAANSELTAGGGVAGAVHRAGDPELEQETRSLAPISPGDAVITSAPNLSNKHIIHCLGPVYGKDKPEDELLAKCYKNALLLADRHQLESIAFPAISTGVFGYPMREAALVAFKSIRSVSAELQNIRLVRFILWNATDFNLHQNVLKEI